MKQSEWKEHIESIEAEMRRRGQDPRAPEIIKQFGTRLSSTIHNFFEDSNSFNPDAPLTIDQKAFMHSLQLYDLQSLMRLVANYDATKGLKVILLGIEKSHRSLMVIQQLEQFTNFLWESKALDAYKFQLEKALSLILKCRREDLYEEDVFAEKMVVVSESTEALRNKFFTERLRTLFSHNYRAYLILKNRYFLYRLKRFGMNPKNYNFKQGRLSEFAPQFENEVWSGDHMAKNFDFRVIEQLVKEQISKRAEQKGVHKESKKLQTPKVNLSGNVSNLHQTESNEVVLKTCSIEENPIETEKTFESVRQKYPEETISAYEQLCLNYEEPLKKLSASFSPIPECSSRYFLSRVEEYNCGFANYFRHLYGENLQVIAAIHNFTLELLLQHGLEYHASERWGVVSKSEHVKGSIYFRSTEGLSDVLDRKAEWSMLIHARLPFRIQLPVEKGKIIDIGKDKLSVFQIGTAFFDQDHQNKLNLYPDVFFKLLFGGDHLNRKNSVIYVEEDPYFTTTLKQMWNYRGLVYLFLIAISHRFAIALSPVLQDFLVGVLPKTIHHSGEIPFTASTPDSENIKE